MSTLTVLGLASLGSIGAMAGAAGIAAAPARWRARLLPLLLAFSAGSMLAAAFLGMLPRAYRDLPPLLAGATVLAGCAAGRLRPGSMAAMGPSRATNTGTSNACGR